jgi:hypothetical protein
MLPNQFQSTSYAAIDEETLVANVTTSTGSISNLESTGLLTTYLAFSNDACPTQIGETDCSEGSIERVCCMFSPDGITSMFQCMLADQCDAFNGIYKVDDATLSITSTMATFGSTSKVIDPSKMIVTKIDSATSYSATDEETLVANMTTSTGTTSNLESTGLLQRIWHFQMTRVPHKLVRRTVVMARLIACVVCFHPMGSHQCFNVCWLTNVMLLMAFISLTTIPQYQYLLQDLLLQRVLQLLLPFLPK